MKELGIVAPIVTPCNRSGEPDLDGVRAVCDDLLGAGIHGIFVAGSTGRGPWFSREHCARICRTVAGHIPSSTPLFAGCMDSGLPGMLENARAMADAGATVAVATAPGYFNYSPQEIETIFTQLADACPLPVMIYDIPGFSGTKLGLGFVLRMARHENVVGFKDSSADFARFEKLLAALAEPSDFWLLQGKENLLADSILAGASGFVVSLLHINAKPFVALYEAARSGNAPMAQQCQARVSVLFEIVNNCFARRPETSTLFHLINAALRQRGVCDNILLEHEGETPDWIKETLRANQNDADAG